MLPSCLFAQAFSHLTKRLKPLEACAASPDEFRGLCYLLTCRSVQEVVREWQGAAAAREELLQLSGAMLALQADPPTAGAGADEGGGCLLGAPLPPRRLLALLEQAAEAQVDAASRRALCGAATGATTDVTVAESAGRDAARADSERVDVAQAAAGASVPADRERGGGGPCVAEGSAGACGRQAAAILPSGGCVGGKGCAGCGGRCGGGCGGKCGGAQRESRASQLGSLLSDYSSPLLPNAPRHTLAGHTGGVKCLAFVAVGESPEHTLLASGGNDATVRIWRLGGGAGAEAGEAERDEGGAGTSDAGGNDARGVAGSSTELWSGGGSRCACVLPQPCRVWALSARRGGEAAIPLLASACADGRIRLYDSREALAGSDNTAWGGQTGAGDGGGVSSGGDVPRVCFVRHTLGAHEGDAYAVALHPREALCLSTGYDGTVRLYDLSTGVHLRSLVGHTRAVTAAAFNGAGNLVASGGKDGTIRFWDLRSGLCVKTLGAPLGEVSSVDLAPNGVHLLSSSRDNALRIWDVRSTRPLRSLKGHQNTARNLVRASFARGGSLAASGSEDGAVYLWDVETGQLAARLPGHSDVVYEARWSDRLGLLASASHDGLVRTWAHDRGRRTAQPLQGDDPWVGPFT